MNKMRSLTDGNHKKNQTKIVQVKKTTNAIFKMQKERALTVELIKHKNL